MAKVLTFLEVDIGNLLKENEKQNRREREREMGGEEDREKGLIPHFSFSILENIRDYF